VWILTRSRSHSWSVLSGGFAEARFLDDTVLAALVEQLLRGEELVSSS
jgi:hypothetical protein